MFRSVGQTYSMLSLCSQQCWVPCGTKRVELYNICIYIYIYLLHFRPPFICLQRCDHSRIFWIASSSSGIQKNGWTKTIKHIKTNIYLKYTHIKQWKQWCLWMIKSFHCGHIFGFQEKCIWHIFSWMCCYSLFVLYSVRILWEIKSTWCILSSLIS